MKKLLLYATLGCIAAKSVIAQEKEVTITNQEVHAILVTNQVVHHYTPVALSATNAPRGKVTRQFQKQCPECGATCVSTNLTWNGGHTEGERSLRDGSVMFRCNCGEYFSEEVHKVIQKTAPMIELPSLPQSSFTPESPTDIPPSPPGMRIKAAVGVLTVSTHRPMMSIEIASLGSEDETVYSPSIAFDVRGITGTNRIFFDGEAFLLGGTNSENRIGPPILVTSWESGLSVTESSGLWQMAVFQARVAILTWDSQPGELYQLQYSDTMDGSDWSNLGNLIDIGTGGEMRRLDDGNNPRRFYRVQVL